MKVSSLIMLVVGMLSASVSAENYLEYSESTNDQVLIERVKGEYYTPPSPCVPNPMTGICEIGDDEGFSSPFSIPPVKYDYWYFANDALSDLAKFEVKIRGSIVTVTKVALNQEDLYLSYEIKQLRTDVQNAISEYENIWLENFGLGSPQSPTLPKWLPKHTSSTNGECSGFLPDESTDSVFDFFSNAQTRANVIDHYLDYMGAPTFLERMQSISIGFGRGGVNIGGSIIATNRYFTPEFVTGGRLAIGIAIDGNRFRAFVDLNQSRAPDGTLLTDWVQTVGNPFDFNFKLKPNQAARIIDDPCLAEEIEAMLDAFLADYNPGSSGSDLGEAGRTCVLTQGNTRTTRRFVQTMTIKNGVVTITGRWINQTVSVPPQEVC